MNKEKENLDSITESLAVSKKEEKLINKDSIKIDDGPRLKNMGSTLEQLTLSNPKKILKK